jgi:hypothetical protein
MTQFPRLHSFAINNKISVAHHLANTNIHHNFHTPISSEETQELSALNQIMMNMQGNHQVRDKWTYIWGSRDLKSILPTDFILLALHLLWFPHLSSGYGNQESPRKSKYSYGSSSGIELTPKTS